ncbi:MAG: prolyl oligopeptidase family serine peptidase [bacterium]
MRRVSTVFAAILLLSFSTVRAQQPYLYPPTEVRPIVDNYHGVEIVDDYQWHENSDDPAVQAWVESEQAFTHSYIDTLPQLDYLMQRFEKLWRYDKDDVPNRVLNGEKVFFMRSLGDKEKSIYMTRVSTHAEAEVVLDPNTWDPIETLDKPAPSRDGHYLAYGVAHGGDENPRVRVLDLTTGDYLPDTLSGWQQEVASWLPDNSGFYYVANPVAGEVPEGEEYYWQRVYFHKLGTPGGLDPVVWSDSEVKERWHYVDVSEDGQYEIFWKGVYYANEIRFRKVGDQGAPKILTDAMDAQYNPIFIGDNILIWTDKDAPMGMVYIASAKKPLQKKWKVLIPESEDKLEDINAIGGRIYVTYMHNASTRIAVYDMKGKPLRDIALPTLGAGKISGHWKYPEVWVSFSSFNYPPTVFLYDFDNDKLVEYSRTTVDVDVDAYEVEQQWFPSKDGTRVSMFLVHRKGLEKNGDNPTLLYGYGGFNISETPYFSTTNITWLELGGVFALVNLRGGGEYGEEWHKAGMFEKKQNVFDDFIAAAEYLINEGYTSSKRLVIAGGSNGGLLTGACVVQRPDLFAGVESAVPLLDMLRYHTNKYAKVWAAEYGDSDNPEQFPYLRAYSPYHNIPEGAVFPPTLFTASVNDARVHPYHARKMVAKMQAVGKGGPILFLERKSSGHQGGTMLSVRMRQAAETRAFLMHCAGLNVPEIQGEEMKVE